MRARYSFFVLCLIFVDTSFRDVLGSKEARSTEGEGEGLPRRAAKRDTRLGTGGIWHGFSVSASPAGSLPTTTELAESQGWTYDGSSSRREGFGYLWTHPTSSFGLYFSRKTGRRKNKLSGLAVTGPEAVDGNGNRMDIPGTRNIGNGMMVYELRFGRHAGSTSLTIGGDVTIPTTATAAADRGWKEEGCVEAMGGSHYVRGDWVDDASKWPNPSPIYDAYGDDTLKSLQLIFGVDDVVRNEFDNGGRSIPAAAGCVFSHCGEPACMESAVGGVRITSVHVYFSDLAPRQDGRYSIATCQLGAESQCFGHAQSCGSCCGSGSDSLEDLFSHCPPTPP